MSDLHPHGHVLVYAPDKSPRLCYVLDEVLKRRLGLDFKITENTDYFNKTNSFKLNYSSEVFEGCINIPMESFLYQEGVHRLLPEIQTSEKYQFIIFPKAFKNNTTIYSETIIYPFDIFSAVFYLLSRYEEYLPHEHDAHGRYLHHASMAFQHGFLETPLVEYWCAILAHDFQKLFPEINIQKPLFKKVISMDIDFLFKYKGLSIWQLSKKIIANILRGEWKKIKQFYQFKVGKIKDPYHRLDTAFNHPHESLFFWLLSEHKHAFDTNLKVESTEYKAVLNEFPSRVQQGIHPSYASSARHNELPKEMQHFKNLFGYTPQKVRAHFLKIHIPFTYQHYEQLGLLEDWSLQYAGHTGFRASTCLPFAWYDLHHEKVSTLTIFPGCYMDVTLKNEMKLTPEAAINKLQSLQNECEKYGGLFSGIWHNSSFDETQGWEGWEDVFENLKK